MRIAILICASSLVLASCKKNIQESKIVEIVKFKNPVIDLDFPDPTVIRGHDGYFYAYATQAVSLHDTINIHVARSKDLIHWDILKDALPQKPSWADTTQSFWAPHVSFDTVSHIYYMYYSGESNSQTFGKCIGVATSKNPEGPFIDKGDPLICGDSFINIDPMAFDDPKTGKKLLYWGSAFLPIKVQELSDDRLSFKPGSSPQDVVAPGKDSDYNILIEGAWLHYRDGNYYLYYSGDNCCGDKANYAVMVAKASEATGPFTRMGETNTSKSSAILKLSDIWMAPGHNSVITDDAGNDWIIYHAINKSKPSEEIRNGTKDRRVMLIDPIFYKDNWPYIRGGVPSSDSILSPVIH